VTIGRHVDLIVVNPGGRLNIYQSLGAKLSAIEPPVWAGLIATYLRKKGIRVEIIDANAENLTSQDVADRVVEGQPLLTALVVYGHNPSASTQVMPAARAICRCMKEKDRDLKILLVGGHVAALPDRTMQEETADFVCDGEGPVTILELLQALSSPSRDFRHVRGLRYREGVEIRSTSPAPLVTALDSEMPGIAWDLLPMEKYRAHNWHCFGGLPRQPYGSLYTTLGCPYRCAFCCIHAPFKTGERALNYRESVNSYRLWSSRTVIEDIDILVGKYGVRNIKFADELFILNRRHVNELCNLLIAREYDLNIWSYARVDTLDDTMLERLAKAGVRWLALGIESASDRVRNDAVKGFSQERIFDAVNQIWSHGIHVGANYIFGLPEDDLESMQATLDLAISLNTEYANFNCAMAYPGSPLYDTAIREGWSLPPDWSGYAQYSSNTYPLPTRHLSGAEVLRFRDWAFQTYFTGGRYQEMILQKFGAAALAQVREMVGHKIERKFI
jgi:radical SAM superfamily enzyme YgiQ (UPF0313 family)